MAIFNIIEKLREIMWVGRPVLGADNPGHRRRSRRVGDPRRKLSRGEQGDLDWSVGRGLELFISLIAMVTYL